MKTEEIVGKLVSDHNMNKFEVEQFLERLYEMIDKIVSNLDDVQHNMNITDNSQYKLVLELEAIKDMINDIKTLSNVWLTDNDLLKELTIEQLYKEK